MNRTHGSPRYLAVDMREQLVTAEQILCSDQAFDSSRRYFQDNEILLTFKESICNLHKLLDK